MAIGFAGCGCALLLAGVSAAGASSSVVSVSAGAGCCVSSVGGAARSLCGVSGRRAAAAWGVVSSMVVWFGRGAGASGCGGSGWVLGVVDVGVEAGGFGGCVCGLALAAGVRAAGACSGGGGASAGVVCCVSGADCVGCSLEDVSGGGSVAAWGAVPALVAWLGGGRVHLLCSASLPSC